VADHRLKMGARFTSLGSAGCQAAPFANLPSAFAVNLGNRVKTSGRQAGAHYRLAACASQR
jgi:hypothetical protein